MKTNIKFALVIIFSILIQSCSTNEEIAKLNTKSENRINLKRLDSLNKEKQSIDLLLHELPAHK